MVRASSDSGRRLRAAAKSYMEGTPISLESTKVEMIAEALRNSHQLRFSGRLKLWFRRWGIVSLVRPTFTCGTTNIPRENKQAFWIPQSNFNSFFDVLDKRCCLALLKGFNCPVWRSQLAYWGGGKEKRGTYHSVSFSPAVGPPNQMA